MLSQRKAAQSQAKIEAETVSLGLAPDLKQMIKRTYRVSLPSSDSRLGGCEDTNDRSHRPRPPPIHLLSRAKSGEWTSPSTDTIKPGTAAIRICGCHFVDSTRSPYSATNSLVDWVR